MFTTLKNAFKEKRVRNKIIFTLLLLLVYRLGSFITIPYVNTEALSKLLGNNSLFSMLNIISGGNFANFTIFAMGITPYINAQIIMSLLTFAIPTLEDMQKDGIDGQRRIGQYTKYLAIALSIIQALGMTAAYSSMLLSNTVWAKLYIILMTTAGTMLLMFIGDSITEHGIGNGISMIIFISIASRIPSGIMSIAQYMQNGTMNIMLLMLLIIFIIAATIAVVAVKEGQRKIPIQYSQRTVNRRMVGARSSYIPLRVNMAGVIPIIFASSIVILPATIAGFFPNAAASKWISANLAWGKPLTTVLYLLFTFLFTFFYTEIAFNVEDISDNIKKQGGYIPGIRPGRPTAEYLSKVTHRLTWFGAVFLAAIAIIPIIVGQMIGGTNIQFGGTSLLILVGVALETVKQVESQITIRSYDGFLK